MTIGGFIFFAKRKDTQTSLIAAILTLTAFEVHRAGINCRVDMLNTAFMVGAMYLLYHWWEKGKHQLPWLAILCMSGATLTKGPVGIILPCFVMGVFMLTQRENFWGVVWRMALTALLSLIIPFCWYYAAYLQGGNEFLELVKEENIDRFMGKMAYESHENPAWYNLLTLITGCPGLENAMRSEYISIIGNPCSVKSWWIIIFAVSSRIAISGYIRVSFLRA